MREGVREGACVAGSYPHSCWGSSKSSGGLSTFRGADDVDRMCVTVTRRLVIQLCRRMAVGAGFSFPSLSGWLGDTEDWRLSS